MIHKCVLTVMLALVLALTFSSAQAQDTNSEAMPAENLLEWLQTWRSSQDTASNTSGVSPFWSAWNRLLTKLPTEITLNDTQPADATIQLGTLQFPDLSKTLKGWSQRSRDQISTTTTTDLSPAIEWVEQVVHRMSALIDRLLVSRSA